MKRSVLFLVSLSSDTIRSPGKRTIFKYRTLICPPRRLEGLAGLSVQDAELKLFAKGNSATVSGQEGLIPATSGLASCSDNSSDNAKKRRKSKKSKGISQRGPLLVTHSGEALL